MGPTEAKADGRRGLSDRVYDRLYKQIVAGRLSPGQRITELQVAGDLGISRAPVREALKRLAEDRLVRLVPRSGCYVCKLAPEEAAEIFEIRKRLECLALEYAFDKFDRKKIAGLTARFTACLALDDAGLIRRELKLDGELHALIRRTAGSENLEVLLNKLQARVQLFRAREAREPARARSALASHLHIMEAIAAGRKNRALRLLLEHIEEAQEYTLARL